MDWQQWGQQQTTAAAADEVLLLLLEARSRGRSRGRQKTGSSSRQQRRLQQLCGMVSVTAALLGLLALAVCCWLSQVMASSSLRAHPSLRRPLTHPHNPPT